MMQMRDLPAIARLNSNRTTMTSASARSTHIDKRGVQLKLEYVQIPALFSNSNISVADCRPLSSLI